MSCGVATPVVVGPKAVMGTRGHELGGRTEGGKGSGVGGVRDTRNWVGWGGVIE